MESLVDQITRLAQLEVEEKRVYDGIQQDVNKMKDELDKVEKENATCIKMMNVIHFECMSQTMEMEAKHKELQAIGDGVEETFANVQYGMEYETMLQEEVRKLEDMQRILETETAILFKRNCGVHDEVNEMEMLQKDILNLSNTCPFDPLENIVISLKNDISLLQSQIISLKNEMIHKGQEYVQIKTIY
jgi:hypothetical protein